LNIQGYAVGAWGLPEGEDPNPDTALFPRVNTETEYGWDKKIKMSVPIFTGALGSTEIARKHWEHFAIGAAISGLPLYAVRTYAVLIRDLFLTVIRKLPYP